MSDEDVKEKQENSSEENENEIENLSKKKKLKNDENLDNQEDEYNSEEDENYDIEEKPKKKKSNLNKKRNRAVKKKKKAKNRVNSLIEREAEEDSNEEEESAYEGELNKEQQKEEMEKAMKQTSSRFQKITDENEDKYLDHIQEMEENQKYDQVEENIYSRPTSDDPKMWIVKCKIGEEKEVMENLYHKFFYFKEQNKKDKEKNKEKVRIYSVTSFENLKGKIYIEAYTERDVAFAIQDMSNVNQNSIQLVPIHERTQIFEYDQVPTAKIFKNQIVRIKGGNYDGDLAKVIYIEDPVNKIHVALVPRIIDNQNDKKGFNVAPFGKTKPFKPRQKLFDKKLLANTEDLEHVKTMSEPYGEVTKLRNLKFLDGLLIKVVRRSLLETENVSCKDEELQKLGCIMDEDGAYTDKNTKEKLNLANKVNVIYKKGDFVKIKSENSEYNGQEGRVIESEKGNDIKIELIIGDIKAQYSMPKNQLVLVKHDFKDGDLVFAKYGENKGRKGMVINVIENGLVTVYDDVTKTKFEAKNSDLIYIEDMDFDIEENEMFKIGELVKIKNSNIVCYIIESTKFIIKVVTTTNKVKKLSVREVNKLILGKRISCIDSKGNPLDISNTVKVIYGQYKGHKGVIKNVYNDYIFLENYDFTRTNGIFCDRKENLELLGSELLIDNGDKANHRRIPNKIKDLIGKTVHVSTGPWKGYNGILITGSDKNVTLELIAKQKTIQVPFDYILEGDVYSAKDNNESVPFNNHVMKTPAYFENKDKWD